MITGDRDPLLARIVALPPVAPDGDRARRVRARCRERLRGGPAVDPRPAVDWRIVEEVLPAAMGAVFLAEIIRRAVGLL